jgi:hypothetical protein
MDNDEVCFYPLNEMVLEYTFDELVEEIGCQKELATRMGEVDGERLLFHQHERGMNRHCQALTLHLPAIP